MNTPWYRMLKLWISLLAFNRPVAKASRDFRTSHLEPFTLARDGVADLRLGSAFSKRLPSDVLSTARKTKRASVDVKEKWPSIIAIFERVFKVCHYDDVDTAVKNENMQDPVATYLISIIIAYNRIPKYINEREGFADLVWPFIRGALTLAGVESRYFEALIHGVDEGKNADKDLLVDANDQGQYCDGLAFFGTSQIYIAEASTAYGQRREKKRQDEFEVARAMRDTWVSRVRSICREAFPPRGLAVFDLTSFKDETQFLQLDLQGVFRPVQIGTMIIPLEKTGFGNVHDVFFEDGPSFGD
ncbi:hypothetical protein BGZ58_009876 [Dissophora ornata]|nr:hypothetical protein BGZ58_009876 [Dissophora ornata]